MFYLISKITHNLKVMEFKIKKNWNLLNNILKFWNSFTKCKWGVISMTFKEIFKFMIQENKA